MSAKGKLAGDWNTPVDLSHHDDDINIFVDKYYCLWQVIVIK